MLSLVHLIYMAGDKCMRQNACYTLFTTISKFEVEKSLWWPYLSPLYNI